MKRVIAFTLLFLFATHSLAYTLDERIAAIKAAPPAQRLELMNNLKRSIAKLNSQQRMRAIRRLRAKIAPHTLSSHTEIEDAVAHSHDNVIEAVHATHTEVMEHQEIFQEHLQREKIDTRVRDEIHKISDRTSTKDLFEDSRR